MIRLGYEVDDTRTGVGESPLPLLQRGVVRLRLRVENRVRELQDRGDRGGVLGLVG